MVSRLLEKAKILFGGLYHKDLGPVILAVLGLGLFVAAAWTISLTLGLAVAATSCFILEWRIGEKK